MLKVISSTLIILLLTHILMPTAINPLPVNTHAVLPLPAKILNLNVEIIQGQALDGPEALAIDNIGRLYTADIHGQIYRSLTTEHGTIWKPFANAKGYPIGLGFDQNTNQLWVANYPLGLQKVTEEGVATTVIDSLDGLRIGFADDVVVSSDGIIYFTEASKRFNPLTASASEPFLLWEMLEGRANGRIISYAPDTSAVEVLVERAFFPSGIALAKDEESLFYTEVSSNRIMRFWLRGEKKGELDVFSENLPGVIDDIYIGNNNEIWVSLISPRNNIFDKYIQPSPVIKNILARLPHSWLTPMEFPAGPSSALQLDANANVICQIYLDTDWVIANMVINNNELIFGVLRGDGLLRVALAGTVGC
jgi:sugar lactone lactonase YvrE